MFPGCRSKDECHRPNSPGGEKFPHRRLDYPGLDPCSGRQVPHTAGSGVAVSLPHCIGCGSCRCQTPPGPLVWGLPHGASFQGAGRLFP
eukprot:12765447-Heterocapsa_arctica.AAC.1